MNQAELDEIYNKLDDNVNYANSVAKSTVDAQTEDLDKLMIQIYDEIIAVEEPPTTSIEKSFLALSNCLYFIGDRLEKIGLYDDISKSQAKEKYNSAYLNAVSAVSPDPKKKVTVAEAQTSAENGCTYENLINSIYARAYKMFKYKVDAAQTMLSSLSKMLSKRMQDQQMAMPSTANSIKQYLVEGMS